MDTETTPPITEQRSAVRVLADLMEQFPELPSGYITVHSPRAGSTAGPGVMLNRPGDFELWRAALDIKPGSVSLWFHGSESWLDARFVYADIPIHITAHGIRLTAAEFTAPRDRAPVSTPITNTADAVRELGALPMPVGPDAD